MSEVWVVEIASADAAALGPLRCRKEIEVLEAGGSVWLRGPDGDDELAQMLQTLPGRRFRIHGNNELVPWQRLAPTGHLPGGEWQSLARWFAVELPVASFAGQSDSRVVLRPISSATPRNANLLLTSLGTWHGYATCAPQVRLDQWAFALNERGEAVVRGTPVAPIAGRRFVEQSGVAVEAGWAWTPAVDAAVVRALLGLEEDDLALLRRDGDWDRIDGEHFVRATRSAVRASLEAVGP